MQSTIERELETLARTEGATVLYACESGSRAWGFSSPDSDYDVRFIYTWPASRYLAIHPPPATIAPPPGKVLDFVGYELSKLLRMLQASNATVFEWLQSPVVYRDAEGFRNALWQVAEQCFSPRTALHHYLGLARGTVERELCGESVRIKKYFYALRAVLAADWIARRGSIPPMTFSALRANLDDDEVQQRIDALLALKKEAGEGFLIARDELLDAFLSSTRNSAQEAAATFNSITTPSSQLDNFFQQKIACT